MNKKDLIDELFRKRSDFKEPDQAETMSNLLDTVSSDIYSESQRFVFELIQNADDAANNTDNEVHFEFHNNCLIVSHNGTPFSLEDIKSLTSAGSSTKKSDPTKTGYKGIGFKSVFGKSERVTIFSDGFQFRFDKSKFTTILPWQIIPIWTELSDLPEEIQKSLSRNKYAVSTIIEIEKAEALQNDLYNLLNNGQILLFLRRVSKISISKNREVVYSIERKIINKKANYNEVALFKGGKEISAWLTITLDNILVPLNTRQELKRDEKTPKKLKEIEHTEISFAAKIERKKIKALKESESLIFTYLPTKVRDFKFPFLVNGSFITNAAREGIHEDKVWNQWLFELIAEKIFEWLAALATSKYKFQLLHLLPNKFNNPQNELKNSFDKSFSKNYNTKKFIITSKENTSRVSEIILDKTGLSNQKFIDIKAITEFINKQKSASFSDDCFINPKLEEPNKLKHIGAETFELDNLETFFISESFTSRHKISENFSLIKYFKDKSENDSEGLWFQTLKTLPFIYDEQEQLCTPSNGVCFPTGIKSTELGDIPLIHSDVFEKIQKDNFVYEWLKKIGIKEPSEVAYVTNVIIPNLHRDDFINETNFAQITHYLFRLFKERLLDDEMLESLRELKLKTKNPDLVFEEAQFCFLSNKYRPQLKIEGVIKEVAIVSEEYLLPTSSELEWNLFFKAIKVKDNIEVETINNNNTLPTLRTITSPEWVNQSSDRARETPGAFGFGESNVIKGVKIPSFLNTTSVSYDYSKLFWKNLIGSENLLSDLSSMATFCYGVGNGHNRHKCIVENYFSWFIQNKQCIPTTAKKILISDTVFINDKEIKQIAGDYLPVFDFDQPLPDDWKSVLRLKNKLELRDYLSILSKIVLHAQEADEKKIQFSPPLKRIGSIYNKIASMLPDMAKANKRAISDWAAQNKLLSKNGNFEVPTNLKWITVEGFSTESAKFKVIQLPENSDQHSETFKELISLFQVQTIDEFIPMFDNPNPEYSLKNKLEAILPYYVVLVEKKKLDDSDYEFERIYRLLNETSFFTASKIRLSFNYQSETFDGPSLTVYKSETNFYFKGKWNSERTLLSLIKELSILLNVTGLNEELRFLLLESEKREIHEWLIEQGVDLTKIKANRAFSEQSMIIPTCELDDNDIPENTVAEPDEEYDLEPEFSENESFTPTTSPKDLDITQISTRKRTYSITPTRDSSKYSKIQNKAVREDIGKWCEEVVYEYLLKKAENIEIIWENKDGESGKPYDFKLIENGKEKFIDVKGTPSETKDTIDLSQNEWVFMFDKAENYSIYRVYNAGKDAHIEIIENPSELLKQGKILPNPITIQI